MMDKQAAQTNKAISFRTPWWVFLYFTLLTIITTWPLALRMGNAIVGQIGDNIYFIWLIGWFNRALFELQVNPFDVWFLNYPQGWSLAYTEITPIQILIAQPFALFGGPVFAYNATMMLTFILAGWGMYLWLRQLTGRHDASIIGGTLFALLPYHFAHFRIGHLNLSSIQWFPFYFMGLQTLLDQSRDSIRGISVKRWKAALLTGIALGLIGLSSQYYLYMTCFVSIFWVIFYLVIIERKLLKEISFWKNLVIAGLVSLPLVIAAIAPYVELFQQGGLPDRNIWIVRRYSASLTDFFLPSTDHFIWGSWIGSHFNRELWIEGSLYIGLVGAVLAVVAWLKRDEIQQNNIMRLLLWGSVFTLILAMGTDLHWNEQPVEIATPGFLAGLIDRPDIPIPLPGYLLFYYFPFYAKLRAMMRFGVFVILFTSAAAGIGSAWLLQSIKKQLQLLLTILVIALIFVDFYPGVYTQFATIEPRPVDYWLAEQPGEGALIQLPFSQAEDQEHTYYNLTHKKPYVGGFFNAFPPEQYLRIRPILENFPDDESAALLRELDVQYALVDVDEYHDEAALRSACQALGLEPLVKIEDQLVFAIK